MHDLYIYLMENIYQFLGVLFSIIYVIFSIKQNIFCWAALILAAIFNMYAYYLIELPLQSIMQLFFIGTGIYGWYNWSKNIRSQPLKVSRWSKKQHILWLSTGFIVTFLITIVLIELQNIPLLYSKYPLLDALMFMFNIIPMYMTGKKILESWIYFIIIDIVSGIFYAITGEFFFCFLFFCYIGFATQGYLTWKKEII